MRFGRGLLRTTVGRRMLPALLLTVLAIGCSAEPAPVEELRPAAVVKGPPPEPLSFQSELLPGAPRVPVAAPNPAQGGRYPIGRARNPVSPGSRVAPVTPRPVQVPLGLPAASATTTTLPPEATTTTTTTTTPPEGPTTTTSAPAGEASAGGAREGSTTTTTTTPLLESEGIKNP